MVATASIILGPQWLRLRAGLFLLLVIGACSRSPAPPSGTITATEFERVLRKANVTLENGQTVKQTEPVVYCHTESACAYVAHVTWQGGFELALVLDDKGHAVFQDFGTAAPDSGQGAYFSDWNGDGTLEFFLRSTLHGVHRTRVIEVTPQAECVFDIVRPGSFFWEDYVWNERDDGVLTFRQDGSGDKVTFTFQRDPLRITVSDPHGHLDEGWTLTGPWASAMTSATSAPASREAYGNQKSEEGDSEQTQ